MAIILTPNSQDRIWKGPLNFKLSIVTSTTNMWNDLPLRIMRNIKKQNKDDLTRQIVKFFAMSTVFNAC